MADWFGCALIGILIGITIGMPLGGYLGTIYPFFGVHVSQDTADNICKNILNNTNAYAINYVQLGESESYKYNKEQLICKSPTYTYSNYIGVLE